LAGQLHSTVPQSARILLLRLREIGDVVFTTPAIRGLREHYPDAHIAYVVQSAAAPVVARNPHIKNVIVRPGRPGLSRLRDDLRLAIRCAPRVRPGD
jgi:ADP-heptose:LPS heptosyltransferase